MTYRYFWHQKTLDVTTLSDESVAAWLSAVDDDDWREVQLAGPEDIVIRRKDVPKVQIVNGRATAGEDENGDPYSCDAGANPNWPYWYGINALAVAEHLRARENAGASSEEPALDRSIVAALAEAAEMVDEIEGSQLNVNGSRVWVHTQEQVADWLRRLLDDNEGAAAEFAARLAERAGGESR